MPSSLTERDKQANTLLPLLTEPAPRTDTPVSVPRPSDDAIALTAAAQPDLRPLSHVQSSLAVLAQSILAKAPALLHEPLQSEVLTTEREGAIVAKFAIGVARLAAPGL